MRNIKNNTNLFLYSLTLKCISVILNCLRIYIFLFKYKAQGGDFIPTHYAKTRLMTITFFKLLFSKTKHNFYILKKNVKLFKKLKHIKLLCVNSPGI